MPESSSSVNLEYQYQLFLKRLGHDEQAWDLETREMLRMMFYGAFEAAIRLFRERAIADGDLFDAMSLLEGQAFQFFIDKLTPKN